MGPFKGVHQCSCRKKFEGTLKIARVIAIFLSEKNSSNFFRKTKFKLKMAIAQSIFKILRSTFFANTPIFLVEEDSAMKNMGYKQSWGVIFGGLRFLRGRKGVTPPKNSI